MRASASVFTSLKHTEQEARTIARLFHGVTFLRQAATADQFKKAAPEYNILHLALHAFTDDEDPTYSGLIFSENTTGTGSNILHAYELSNMSLNADLVVLSACNTGGGKLAKGEGVMSLARAFRHANCPNIVMSLWQADDEATGKIMADFYRGLKNGLRKDVALQQAKLNYLATNRKCFPYYWSEFVLLGGSDPISRPSSDLWLKWAMGLLVLTGVLWWLKIRFF